MAARLTRRLIGRRWRTIAGAVAMIGAVASLAGSAEGGAALGAPGPSGLRVLQLNLCDSGIASCYTGRSVQAASAVIEAARPDVVTLDEICRPDLSALASAVASRAETSMVASAFAAAVDRPTGGPFRCRDGQPYGIGVLLRAAPAPLHTYRGRYPIQDRTDPEERVWVCIHAVTELYACATHTANTSTGIAVAQCRYLLTAALPAVLDRGGQDPFVLGADLNLFADRTPGPQACVPPADRRVDDGLRQDVVASADLRVRSHATIDMRGTTDHPGLLVELVR